MAYLSNLKSGFQKIVSQPYVELNGDAQNDKVEQIGHTLLN